MEYHEIGERFEYEGVVLEVVEITDFSFGVCDGCYLADFDTPCYNRCRADERDDKKDVFYKLVEQCKTKDMEQKTEIFVSGIDEHAIKIDENTDEQLYGSLLNKLFTTYKAKNHDYSGAFTEMFDELGIDYAYGKLREKINRIKVLRNQPNMVENEGLEDALLDTAGYAILTLVELKKRKQ